MTTAANLPPVSDEVVVVGAEEAARNADKQNMRHGRAKLSAPLTGLMWLIVGIYALPLLWFILSSFKPGSELFTYPLSMIPRSGRSRASSTRGSAWTLRSTS
ncbi:hypothetical protein ACW0JT_08930 [Arthrobacter sp. SA17]